MTCQKYGGSFQDYLGGVADLKMQDNPVGIQERHLWDYRESLLRLLERGAVERAGLEDQHGGIFIQVRAASDA